MSDLKDKKEVLRSEALDKTSKIISSLIPGGATVYELYRTLVVPLHEKKAQEWQNDVIRRLAKLEQDGIIDLQKLQENEEFNSIITRAVVLTLQNHEKEKLDALKNVVINSAIDDYIEFEMKHYFLLFLDQISTLHILLLKIFHNPIEYGKQKGIDLTKNRTIGGSTINVLFQLEPDLKSKKQLVELIWKDLSDKKLVTTSSLNAMVSGNSLNQPLTSELGENFLQMITEKEL